MSEGGEIIVKPIVDGFVGEITGLDLASGLGARTKSLLSRAHEGFPVLAIRDLSLNADSFMAFGAVFGDFEIDHHLPQFQDKDHRSVVYLTNRDENGESDPASAKQGAAWHADSTYKEHPCDHTLLYVMAMPGKGAGTLFVDIYRAYAALPGDLDGNAPPGG